MVTPPFAAMRITLEAREASAARYSSSICRKPTW
jgi:hypothetical protein